MKKGIKKITIPLKLDEVKQDNIEKYINFVYDKFSANAHIIRHDYDEYCLDHPIMTKVRAHQDTDINNRILIPDLKAMVDWKTGYVYGNPIKYAQTEFSSTDDISYINKYSRDVCKRTIDKEVGKWCYATGVGYYFIEPKSEDFDIENQAPFVLLCREADTCAKIYSSFNGNEPLFDILYTSYEEEDKMGIKTTTHVLDIYTNTQLFTYKKTLNGEWKLDGKVKERGMHKPLPLVEKRMNEDGIGMVAMGTLMQYAVDKILSNGVDNVEEAVNEVFVYKNVLLGTTPEEKANTHRTARKNGAIELISDNKDFPADLTTISTKLNLSEVRELFAIIDIKFHSSLGVPMEISNTNSGGTTKQGSEVSNGYDNAYNRALDDINTFLLADTELLKKILWICKNSSGNKIDNLSASSIEIKYSLNLSDNMLTKAQAYAIFIQTMPPAMALRLTRLSNDPEAEGKIIEEGDIYKAYLSSLLPKIAENKSTQ